MIIFSPVLCHFYLFVLIVTYDKFYVIFVIIKKIGIFISRQFPRECMWARSVFDTCTPLAECIHANDAIIHLFIVLMCPLVM